MNQERTLNVIGGQYDRSDYEFLLFIGDKEGCVVVSSCDKFTHHFDIVRFLVVNKFVKKTKSKYVLVADESAIHPLFLIGPCQSIDVVYSGVILPKQEGVNGSYISFWYKEGIDLGQLSRLLITYVKDLYAGPYFIETASRDDDEPPVRFSI